MLCVASISISRSSLETKEKNEQNNGAVSSVMPQFALAEYRRSYYQKRKRLGVCVSCGRKVETGKSQCGVCLRKKSERKMELRPGAQKKLSKQIFVESITGLRRRNIIELQVEYRRVN